MSDFKFDCPTCGQNILCDTSNAGMQVTCPGCQTTITVPAPPPPPPPAAGTKLSINKTAHAHSAPPPGAANAPAKPAWGAKAEPPPPKKMSVLAIVSLVCSLLGTIGCLPAIVCGHMARARISRSNALKGKGLAMAGLILGYLSLVGTIAWFAVAVPYLKKQAAILQQQQEEAARQAEAARVAEEAAKAKRASWKLDLGKANFPDRPASGKLHAMDFTVETALLQGGNLTLVQTNGSSRAFVIALAFKPSEIPGKSIEITDTDTNKPPRVTTLWRDEGAAKATSRIFTNGYAMKLEFGEIADGNLPGKIYLSVPDDEKSFVAGNFEITPRRAAGGPGEPPPRQRGEGAPPKRKRGE